MTRTAFISVGFGCSQGLLGEARHTRCLLNIVYTRLGAKLLCPAQNCDLGRGVDFASVSRLPVEDPHFGLGRLIVGTTLVACQRTCETARPVGPVYT